MVPFVITPAAGKRLIAKAVAQHEAVLSSLESGTIVIVAGTTNGYVAEEVLQHIGQQAAFHRQRFFRGITTPPAVARTDTGRLPDQSRFPGDVVIKNGTWEPGRTIFEVVDDLREGDVILKGANAVDLDAGQAAILIGHPKGGTVLAALHAVVGRRVRLVLPVGLEKRVPSCLDDLASIVNAPGAEGPRLLPVSGEVVTEIEALRLLAGVQADLVAAGGVCGAEGCVWLGVRGSGECVAKARELLESVAGEPTFAL
jgi:hypothetical protein